MASISVHNLHSTGADLFTDSESYLHDLSEAELLQQGGMADALLGVVVGYVMSRIIRNL